MENLDSLWQNCFAGTANLAHMNAYVPSKISAQFQLNVFLQHSGHRYDAWLIKRTLENDIIGFVIHGDFYPGLPNNIGFNIGLNYLNQGYATETLLELMAHLKRTGIKETYGHCFDANIASIRTMEKCGFKNLGPTGKVYTSMQELKFKATFE